MAPLAITKPVEFQWQSLSQLGLARARLNQLRAELDALRSNSGTLHDEINDAQEALLRTETDAQLGEAKPADVIAARQRLETARKALDAYRPGNTALLDEIKRVREIVDRLEPQELSENRARLKPVYGAAVAELDAALEAARLASERLTALQAAGREASRYWPAGWIELTPQSGYGYTGTCLLNEWRRQARQMGLLD